SDSWLMRILVICNLPVLLHRDAAHLDEFGFQIVEVVVVERKLALEGAIREALILLKPVDDLCEDLFEGHSLPSTRRVALRLHLLGPILPEPRMGLHARSKPVVTRLS